MAKQLAALLGGVDIQRLAELVRQHGRGKDTVLAHITPREAEILKANGGSGAINPMTGLPEFQSEFDYAYAEAPIETSSYQPSTYTTYTPEGFSYAGTPETFTDVAAETRASMGKQPFDYLALGEATGGPSFGPAYQGPTMPTGMTDIATRQTAQDLAAQIGQEQIPAQRDYGQMAKEGAKQLFGTREGLGLSTALLAGLNARRGYQQANRIRQELGQLGQAQRAVGQEQVAMGQAGQVTPAQRQQLEALAAQQRQQLAQRGLTSGTAAQQAQARQVELQQRMASDLLQTGLSNLGVADAATRQALIAGYQADAATSDALMQALMASAQLATGTASQTPYRTATTLPAGQTPPPKG
jgi:hypothetical protein